MTNPIEGLEDRTSDAQLSGNGVLASVAAVLRSGTGFLFGIFHQIVNGIRGIAPLMLSLGCQAAADDIASEPPAMAATLSAPMGAASTATAPDAPRVDSGPRQIGLFSITFYYVVGEEEHPTKPPLIANDNRGDGEASEQDADLAAIAADRVTLYNSRGCEPIADVSKAFESQLRLQGTGRLHDGRVLNIWGACNCRQSPCYKVTRSQWGTAGTGRPLQPFRTIAVDPKVVKLGSLLYVPLLEGRRMPGRAPWGGYIHDGCVVADDTGGHIKGNRIDFFVGRKAYFVGLGRSGSPGKHAWARNVPVFDGSGICERSNRRVGRKAAAI